jgi:hypothetical protein
MRAHLVMATALLAGLAVGNARAQVAAGPAEAVDAGVEAPPAPPPVETDLSAIPQDRRPSVKLTVSPTGAAIGEAVVWRAEVRHRVGDRVHMGSDASFGAFEVQDRKVAEGEKDGDWIAEVLEIRLVSFETGALEIPAQAIAVVTDGGAVGQLATEPAKIEVKSLIANEPEPKLKPDLGPGERVFVEDYTPLYVLGAVAAAAAIVLLTLLGRWLWSKRRQRPLPPPPPPRPAEEIALEKLEALRASAHLAEGRFKLFHILLSEAYREYLGNRYRFDSLERSTEELLGELKRRRIERTLFQRTVDFLSETDLVKFAKYVPDAAESSRLLDAAFALVHDTTPKPEAPAPAVGAAVPDRGGPHA